MSAEGVVTELRFGRGDPVFTTQIAGGNPRDIGGANPTDQLVTLGERADDVQ